VWCAIIIGAQLSASNGRGGGSGMRHCGRAMAAGRVLMALDGLANDSDENELGVEVSRAWLDLTA
jgi:hypothetical protein